jgi:hypothetical protein
MSGLTTHFFSNSREFEASVAGQPAPKLATKKLKRVEKILSKQTVLYDSEDKDPQSIELVMGALPVRVPLLDGPSDQENSIVKRKPRRVEPCRTPLPHYSILRSASNSFVPVLDDSFKKSSARSSRRFSAALRSTQSHNPSPFASLRGIHFFQPVDLNCFGKLFPPELSRVSDRYRGVARTMSFNDLDTLEPIQDPHYRSVTGLLSSDMKNPDFELEGFNDGSGELNSRVLPVWCNKAAVRQRKLTRRQSFPSLGNKMWKIDNTSKGIL